MKNWLVRWVTIIALAGAAVGCGGGEGSGEPLPGGGGGGGGGADPDTFVVTMQIQRTGTAVTTINSSETVQAVATVRTSGGSAAPGVVVTFSETGASLLKFAPQSATALTDDNGQAAVDISAVDASQTGATTVSAVATVGGAQTTPAAQAIQITAGSTGGGGTPAVPAAINFIGANPSGTAIVIKGTGGSGRSESAILTFRVVDENNAPINAAPVNFAINASNGGATISPPSAVSNSNGQVTVTVSSGTQPASIVVTATTAGAGGATVSAQSDTLLVSNSVVVPRGFEIVAAKYNLNGGLTGDSTTITAFVRDEFGNPVPDGLAVSFTTDYGSVASSTMGGCTTVNGSCTVTFRVQEPRNAVTGIATVIGTVRVGDTTQINDSLQINMSEPVFIVTDAPGGTPVTVLQLDTNTCKQVFELYLSNELGRSPPAGTTVTAPFTSSGVTVTVKTGNPVADTLDASFPPVLLGIEIDVATAAPAACSTTSGNAPVNTDNFLRLEFTTPNGLKNQQRIELNYTK